MHIGPPEVGNDQPLGPLGPVQHTSSGCIQSSVPDGLKLKPVTCVTALLLHLRLFEMADTRTDRQGVLNVGWAQSQLSFAALEGGTVSAFVMTTRGLTG